MDSDNQEVFYSEDEVVFCDICDKLIEPNSNCSYLKALSYEEFDRYKHIKLTIKNPDINEMEDKFDSYNLEHNKNFDYYLIKYDFKLNFYNYENSPHLNKAFLEFF